MKSKKDFTFSLGVKVSERHIDKLVNDLFLNYKRIKANNEKFIFDFSDVTWISNQELLVVTGVLKYLVNANIQFKVNFLKNGSSREVDIRVATQIIQIWDVWKIYLIVPGRDYNNYFDIDSKFTETLKAEFGLNFRAAEIYDRHGVTPFVALNRIENYNDREIIKMLQSVYSLNDAIEEILVTYNCKVPFLNGTLSAIITKELYENFLDHFKHSFFGSSVDQAFMSVSLKAKLNESSHDHKRIQFIIENNFRDESIPELKDFYYSEQVDSFRNISLLQFSFLDFGVGIASTLKEQYNKSDKTGFSEEHFSRHEDTRILEYAFQFDSSKDPIDFRYLNKSTIPRGLFDLVSIVCRFKGLLVARSNYGKVLFDFSVYNSPEKAVRYFGDEGLYFPGTLISIYLPERGIDDKIASYAIKPNLLIGNISLGKRQKTHLHLYEIQKSLKNENLSKERLYSELFRIVTERISRSRKNSLVYVDFAGYDIDDRISKKLIYFLISDYHVNHEHSVIILNPPTVEFLDVIKNEISLLSETVNGYKIHPTPFIYYNKFGDEMTIYWLGVFSDGDIDKLNDLLFDFHDLRRSDFESPDSVIGNINSYDSQGNLFSLIAKKEILEVLTKEALKVNEEVVNKIISRCIKKEASKIYLCNGNYYQEEYLQLFDALSNSDDCEYLSKCLFDKIISTGVDVAGYKIICITSSSRKIVDYLIKTNLISEAQTILLNNYHSSESVNSFQGKIRSGDRTVLICDVISTGFMTTKLQDDLEKVGAELSCIAVLVDAIDPDFEPEVRDYSAISQIKISLVSHKMIKYRRKAISKKLISGELTVVRINPYTNTPITLSHDESNFKESVLLSNQAFLDLIKIEHIKAGYFRFNNLIHPYFFDMDGVLRDPDVSKSLLTAMFGRMDRTTLDGIEVVFYPRKSGIGNLDFDFFRNNILKNQKVEIVELERFSTNEGWRFPHPAKYLYDVAGAKNIMILDDGSCSGESIIQMMDEIAFLNVKSILVLSIIGRVSDHKREFFSRLKVINNKTKKINVHLVFGCHWHIPTYYFEESPVIKEKQWLEEIIRYPNIPKGIRSIATNVLRELELKDVKDPSNKYLLRHRDGTSIIKELLLTKEEIGKISTFRFYKEYFNYFDEFILTYEKEDSPPDRYKTVELISEVFLHEPYLYEKIRTILPDLTEKMEEFVQALLLGNPVRPNKLRLPLDKLFFSWQTKDILHLLFIVFKDHRLFKVLDSNSLSTIISDISKNPSDINYLFYKFLSFFPLDKKSEQDKRYSGKVQRLIDAVIEKNQVPSNVQRMLKRFRSFTTTLPFNEGNFDSALTQIKDNFSRLTDDKYHEESMSMQADILQTQLATLTENYSSGTEQTIILTWEKFSPFIDELLSFSKSYPEYFAPCADRIYNMLELNKDSLRNMQGELSESIYNLNPGSNSQRIYELVRKVYVDFISSTSDLFRIFNNTSTPDLGKEFNLFKEKVKNEFVESDIKEKKALLGIHSVSIPLFFVNEILFSELLKNFRHCDISKPIFFEWEHDSESITLNIKNTISGNSNLPDGGGSGLVKLEAMNQIPNQVIYYSKKFDGELFVQTVRLRKI